MKNSQTLRDSLVNLSDRLRSILDEAPLDQLALLDMAYLTGIREATDSSFTLSAMQKIAYQHAFDNGLWEGSVTMEAAAARMDEEMDELADAAQKYKTPEMMYEARSDHPEEAAKPVGFLSELADIVILAGSICGALGLDLETAVKMKMTYNATRAYGHKEDVKHE